MCGNVRDRNIVIVVIENDTLASTAIRLKKVLSKVVTTETINRLCYKSHRKSFSTN